MKIDIIPTLSDNYTYAVIDSKYPSKVLMIDAGESAPLIEYLQDNKYELTTLLITHHHYDHTDGIGDIIDFSPQTQVIMPTQFQAVQNIDNLSEPLKTYKTPGHTLDHVCYQIGEHLFTGDLLFHMGCGRVLEGTFEQTLNSLNIINELPDNTLIYPGHEYTRDNLSFCIDFFKSTNLESKYQVMREKLPLGKPSVPTTLALQQELNPFLASNLSRFLKALDLNELTSQIEFFTKVRRHKDRY